jgi:hypothetical protein
MGEIAHMPVIQHLGNMAKEGSVCHINALCFMRKDGLLEPITLDRFYKATDGHASEVETWDPTLGEYA